MTAAPITSVYAAMLALLFFALSVRVIVRRRASGILLGTAGNRDLEQATRAHGNFAEYVPLGLVLMLLVEQASPAWLVHAVGLALLFGRLAHALGLSRPTPDARLRVVGMTLTFTALTVSALALLWSGLRTLV